MVFAVWVQVIAERDLAGSMIYGLFGPGLTGDIVRTRAKDIFYQIDKDGGGSLDPRELQNWFARSSPSTLCVRAFMCCCTRHALCYFDSLKFFNTEMI
jgi:hypothetical protein